MRTTDALGLVGYALAAPFTVYPPLFKTMWNGRDTRLLAVHETGVALIVLAWAARQAWPAVAVNGGYGLVLLTLWVRAGRRG